MEGFVNTRHSTLHTWLQLFRAPNLFTVPGDPLAGFLLANAGFLDHTLVFVILASVCFYSAGLLQNDLADEEVDRQERPDRPIPSGAARRTSVQWTLWALNLGGILLCAATQAPRVALTGAGIVLAVTLYNRFTKHLPVLGAVNMGVCRGLSVLLGAFAGPLNYTSSWTLALLPTGIFAVYIAAVTNLARHETRSSVPIFARLFPSLVIVGGAAAGISFALTSPSQTPASFFFALAAIATLWLAVRLFKGRTPLPPLIGAHIRVLLILQAAVCYLADPRDFGRYAAFVLLALWPISARVSRRFYAS
ncbi:MAG: hypothetical protein EOP84_10185 [Verrucomicrobiaceae bacterium]|nr:MAG: hypothetical protein EOP84_10185 [Verrucomicrobiaceae bacterium]